MCKIDDSSYIGVDLRGLPIFPLGLDHLWSSLGGETFLGFAWGLPIFPLRLDSLWSSLGGETFSAC